MLPVLNLSCFSLRVNAFFNDQIGDDEKDPRHLRGGVGYGRWRVIAPAKPVGTMFLCRLAGARLSWLVSSFPLSESDGENLSALDFSGKRQPFPCPQPMAADRRREKENLESRSVTCVTAKREVAYETL